MPIRRRSIVEFEKWLDEEIKEAELKIRGLVDSKATEQARLSTLREAKAKLQLPEKTNDRLRRHRQRHHDRGLPLGKRSDPLLRGPGQKELALGAAIGNNVVVSG